jgi:hypothetical protein
MYLVPTCVHKPYLRRRVHRPILDPRLALDSGRRRASLPFRPYLNPTVGSSARRYLCVTGSRSISVTMCTNVCVYIEACMGFRIDRCPRFRSARSTQIELYRPGKFLFQEIQSQSCEIGFRV